MSKSNIEKAATITGGCIAGIVIIVMTSLIMSLPVWLLWNWLMPTIFGLTKLTWVQAWGISLLSNCLFKRISYSDEI